MRIVRFLRTALTPCLIVVPLLWVGVAATAPENQAAEADLAQGKVWVEERTGAVLPLEREFLDEEGNRVTLGSLITKPTILLPIYFYCPNSCSTNLANLAVAMDHMKLIPGKDYRAIALSFNERDTPKEARDAKRNYLKLLDDDFPAGEWQFITGSTENVSAVLGTIGYEFKPLADGTFVHPSTLVAVAGDGTVIKYVYGNFIPGDVEMALVEAERGVPALSVKRLLNFCFNYDPDANKSTFQYVKAGVLVVFGGLILLFFTRLLRRRDSGNT